MFRKVSRRVFLQQWIFCLKKTRENIFQNLIQGMNILKLLPKNNLTFISWFINPRTADSICLYKMYHYFHLCTHRLYLSLKRTPEKISVTSLCVCVCVCVLLQRHSDVKRTNLRKITPSYLEIIPYYFDRFFFPPKTCWSWKNYKKIFATNIRLSAPWIRALL